MTTPSRLADGHLLPAPPRGGERGLWSLPPRMRTLIPSWGPTHGTSSPHNPLPQPPPPHRTPPCRHDLEWAPTWPVIIPPPLGWSGKQAKAREGQPITRPSPAPPRGRSSCLTPTTRLVASSVACTLRPIRHPGRAPSQGCTGCLAMSRSDCKPRTDPRDTACKHPNASRGQDAPSQ